MGAPGALGASRWKAGLSEIGYWTRLNSAQLGAGRGRSRDLVAGLRLRIPVWDEGWRWISCLDAGGRWRGEEPRPSRMGHGGPLGPSRALRVNLWCQGHAPPWSRNSLSPGRFVPSPTGPSPSPPHTLPHPTLVLALPAREHQRCTLHLRLPCPYLPLSALNQATPSSS